MQVVVRLSASNDKISGTRIRSILHLRTCPHICVGEQNVCLSLFLCSSDSSVIQCSKRSVEMSLTMLSRNLVEFDTDTENRKDCMYLF